MSSNKNKKLQTNSKTKQKKQNKQTKNNLENLDWLVFTRVPEMHFFRIKNSWLNHLSLPQNEKIYPTNLTT